MQKLIKSPLFYVNLILLVAFFLLVTSINVNQTNLPSFLKKAIAAVQAITGEGGVGYLSAFTATNQIGNSIIYDNGTNIGIGNTIPATKLDVSGSTAIRNTLYIPGPGSGSEGGEIVLGNPTNTGLSETNSWTVDNLSGNLRFFYNATNPSLYMNTSGNVGVGTTAPSSGAKMTVTGGGSLAGLLWQNGTTDIGTLGFSANSDAYISAVSTTNKSLIFRTGGADRITINNIGNVGIGTNTPGQKLDVQGNINIGGSQINMSNSGNNFYGDTTNLAVRMDGMFYVQTRASGAANVWANDYWINSANKWASQMGGGVATPQMRIATGKTEHTVKRCTTSGANNNINVGFTIIGAFAAPSHRPTPGTVPGTAWDGWSMSDSSYVNAISWSGTTLTINTSLNVSSCDAYYKEWFDWIVFGY